MAKLSPMMEQYFAIKKKHQDQILFFRLGDFYEMFFEDATDSIPGAGNHADRKSCGLKERAPMCEFLSMLWRDI